MADPSPRDRPTPDLSVGDPSGTERPVSDSPAGEALRPPGPHHVVDPQEVSAAPVLSPSADKVSDAEGELLVGSATHAGPTWASSRVIAGSIAVILMGLTVGVGAWLAGWLSDDGEEALGRGAVLTPAERELDEQLSRDELDP